MVSAQLAAKHIGDAWKILPVTFWPSHGVVAPYTGGEILFGTSVTRHDVGLVRSPEHCNVYQPTGKG